MHAYSYGIKAGNLVFSSGQIPINSDTSEMHAFIKEAGSSLYQAIKLTVFLQDINDFDAMNEVYVYLFA